MRDITNRLHIRPAFEPKAAVADNTAQVSAIVDLSGYDGCMLVLVTGTLTDADATFAVTMEHGDQSNLSDAAACGTSDLTGTVAGAGFTFADDVEARKIGYVGSKRYVRATVTPSNNTGNLFLGGLWVLGIARYGPTAFPS
jgi:hypothetical protein